MSNIFKDLAVEFKQDYLNLDETVAISSEGEIFKVGDVVSHEGLDNKGETSKIERFSKNMETNDVIAHTDKGYGRISFLYHP